MTEGRPTPGAVERLDATVRGKVQGVGFRVFVLREAEWLGLSGTVRNLPDGGVHVIAEGPSADLDALEERLGEGPPAGFVDRVIARREPARGEAAGFRISHGDHRGD